MALIIYADGESKGNPGRAGGSAIIVDGNGNTGKILHVYAKRCGHATNNVAEWTGLLLALRAAVEYGLENPVIRMDSHLVVQQFLGPENGGFPCEHQTLAAFRERAVQLAQRLTTVDIQHIPREHNLLADKAANDLLKNHIRESVGEPDVPIVATAALRAAKEPRKPTEAVDDLNLFGLPGTTEPSPRAKTKRKGAAPKLNNIAASTANVVAALRFAHPYASLIAQTTAESGTTAEIQHDIEAYLTHLGGPRAKQNLR